MALMDIKITLFGGFRLTTDNQVVEIKAQKSKALLAWLALQGGARGTEAQARERLTDLLWEDRSQENARASLRQALAALRRVLPDALISEGKGVRLNLDTVTVDALEFRRLKSGPSQATLREAIQVYRGELLDGFRPKAPAFEEWLLMEREMLRQEALAVMSRLLDAELESNQRPAAIETAVRMLSLDPLQEGVHRHLMRLYVAEGQLGSALRQFRICRDVLERELAAPPAHETMNLYRAIRAGDIAEKTAAIALTPSAPERVVQTEANDTNSPDRNAQLRHATVLYVGLDSSSSDTHAEAPKTQEREHLEQDLAEIIDAQVEADGGASIRQSGEDFLVVYGLHQPNGRDVNLGLQAALALHEAWQSFGAHNPAAIASGTAAGLQIGIAFGQVMVSDDAGALQVAGNPVSDAAALCVQAKPGQTVISTAVMRSMSDAYRCERIDKARVVNAGQPWLLLNTNDAQPSRRAVLPSIAVLPFMSMSTDPEHGYLADGMTEELITLLAHSVNWRVTARNSSFRYKNKHVDVREIGEDLGVGYVVEGSIRRVGGRIRVTAQLIKTEDGTHFWSDKYDRSLDEIFDVQDEVVHSIFRVLRNRLSSAERERIRRTHKANLDAWGLLMKAMQIYVVDDETRDAQRGLVMESLAIDPSYPRARAYMASILCISVGRGFSSDHKADLAAGMEHAELALAAGESDQVVLRMCAGGFAAVGESQRALALAERAHEISEAADPLLVAVLMWNGRLDEATAHCESIVAGLVPGMQGSPAELRPVSLLGNLYMLKGEYEIALDYALQDERAFPGNYFSHINTANLYGFLGRIDEARQAWDQARTLMPKLTVRGFNTGYSRVFVDPKLAARFSAGLVKAGLE